MDNPIVTRPTSHRHALLVLVRLALGACVLVALPVSHAQWGEPYPGDGQQAFGFIVIFMAIGFVAAFFFFALGSLAQFLLRSRAARYTVLADAALFATFAALLVYGGVTAKYGDAATSHAAPPP